ncbi:MAG: DUF4037 domain-containing protein [Clostridia bacterium]|nr:DUF4037 domain-containing protein [Clostridia bacterium]
MSQRLDEWVDEGRRTIAAFVERNPALASQPLAVVLGGSAVTPYADAFSGLDFFVFGFGAEGARWEDGLVHRARAAGRRFHYRTRDWQAFERELAAFDDDALYLRRYGRVCYDPHGFLRDRWEVPPVVPPEVWLRKAEQRYAQLRQRQASLAWAIRRGQAFLVCDNLLQILSHALAIALLLDQEPVPPRKWLMQAAFRTSTGRRLRPLALDLFERMGDLVSLGGALNPRQNRLYALAQEIQTATAMALEAAGAEVGAAPTKEVLP